MKGSAVRFRVMTYNVHRCVGVDRKLSVERIAGVIAEHEPDIVALQELDVGRRRTRHVDQAELLARRLSMKYGFHSTLRVEEEQYGDAILTRFPMRVKKADHLPSPIAGTRLEPRGAIWSAIEVGGATVQVINTHLGLWPRERLVQIEALLRSEWLRHPDCRPPRILLGDLNATPRSPVYRKLSATLRDVQAGAGPVRAPNTWFSYYPIRRIDHIFAEVGLKVRGVSVARGPLARVASDHLPLYADLELPR